MKNNFRHVSFVCAIVNRHSLGRGTDLTLVAWARRAVHQTQGELDRPA